MTRPATIVCTRCETSHTTKGLSRAMRWWLRHRLTCYQWLNAARRAQVKQ